MATYKVVMRPALEYASSVWSPIASSASIGKLQVMQGAALGAAAGCTRDATYGICMTRHSRPHARAPAAPRLTVQAENTHPSHPLHRHTTYFNTPRLKERTVFDNGRYTTNIPHHRPHTVTTTDIKTNMRHIHTSIVSSHLATEAITNNCAHLHTH